MDRVHDLQSVFRTVLLSMSRPGVISSVADEAAKVNLSSPCYSGTLLVALMLLDTEVSFCAVSPRAAEFTRLFGSLTYAKSKPCHDADYIFVLADASGEARDAALSVAKTGLLTHPHRAATVIMEAQQITDDEGLVLRGPGIQSEHIVAIQTAGEWVGIRAEQNREYPLGIDLIFLDADARLICIPRTTTIEERR